MQIEIPSWEYLNWQFNGDTLSLTKQMDEAGIHGWEIYSCAVIPTMIFNDGTMTYFICAKRKILQEKQ